MKKLLSKILKKAKKHCGKCGYSWTGAAGERCPQCGSGNVS